MANFNLTPFAGSNSILKAAELNEYLAEEMFIRPDVGLTNRTMNNWEAEGLIENRRDTEQRWRRFNFVEFVWLRLIHQMREIGVPIGTIKKAKDWIMEEVSVGDLLNVIGEMPQVVEEIIRNADESEAAEMREMFSNKGRIKAMKNMKVTALQLFIAQVVTRKSAISLAIFLDGDVLPVIHGVPFEEGDRRIWEEPHAVVSISLIIKEFLASDLAPERMQKLHLLEENEEKLMEIIHSGEYESVKVNFRDGTMKSLELVKSQDTKRKIVDVLADAKYQDITIKTHKGMISTIQNTIKIQFDRP